MIKWNNESSIDTFHFGFITKDSILIDYYKKPQTLRNKPIKSFFNDEIKHIDSMQCVFIDRNHKKKLKTISNSIIGKPILLITYRASAPGLSMVNIYKNKKESSLKFEISKQNLDKSNFIYNNELLLIGGNNINDFKELYVSTNKVLETKTEEIDSIKQDLLMLELRSSEYKKQLKGMSDNMQVIEKQILSKEQDLLKKDSDLKLLNAKLEQQKKQKTDLYNMLESKMDSINIAEKKLQLLSSNLKNKRDEIRINQLKIDKQKNEIKNQQQKIKTQNKKILTISTIGIGLIIILFIVFLALKTKRTLANRLEILVKEKTKGLNESRLYYQSLFEDSPVSICEFDLSELINTLKNDYNIVSEELNIFDDFILKATDKIKINDANFQTLMLFNSVSKQEFVNNYSKLFNTDSIPGLKEFT
jgi:hypothetical protein